MTYCFAWKTDTAALVIADSATTSNRPSQGSGYSTFGEQTFDSTQRSTEETALKINPIGNTLFTYSGDVRLGSRIESRYAQCLINGSSPSDALNTAISQIEVVSPERVCEVLVAFTLDSGPVLLSYCTDESRTIIEHDHTFHTGCISPYYKGLTDSMLRKVLIKDVSDEVALVAALALAQSYGCSDYLMEKGVGGVFSGMYVDDKGTHWFPDLLYVIHDRIVTSANGVAVISRKNIVLVKSGLTDGVKVFGNTLSANCDLEMLESLVEELETVFDAGRFAYVVFINTMKSIVVIIEMSGSLHHDLISISPSLRTSDSDSKGIGFEFTDRLRSMLTEPVEMDEKGTSADYSLKVIPYKSRSKIGAQ